MTTLATTTNPPAAEVRHGYELTHPDDAHHWHAVVADWLSNVKLRSVNTHAAYKRDVEMWTLWCRENAVVPWQAKRSDVRRYADELTRHIDVDTHKRVYKDSTIARMLASLSGLYRFAIADDEERFPDITNPVQHVNRPQVSREHDTDALDDDEVDLLLATAEATSLRDHAYVLLLYARGMRVSEIVSASVGDLTVNRGLPAIKVRRKNKGIVKLGVAPSVDAVVREYIAGRRYGPLILTLDGKKGLTRRAAASRLLWLARKAGVRKKVTPHVLRHTAITALREKGVDLLELQEFAGHSSSQTTLIYIHAASTRDVELSSLLADRHTA